MGEVRPPLPTRPTCPRPSLPHQLGDTLFLRCYPAQELGSQTQKTGLKTVWTEHRRLESSPFSSIDLPRLIDNGNFEYLTGDHTLLAPLENLRCTRASNVLGPRTNLPRLTVETQTVLGSAPRLS